MLVEGGYDLGLYDFSSGEERMDMGNQNRSMCGLSGTGPVCMV